MTATDTEKHQEGYILISGGSRGLGAAIVRLCLTQGQQVVTFSRSETEELRALQAEFPEQLLYAALDSKDTRACGALLDTAAKRFGPLRALVNNAAIGQDSLLVSASEDSLKEIIEVDLLAPLLLTRLSVKRMLLDGVEGRIVFISSICGSRGYPGLSAYSAAKGGLDALTRSLARELGERKILVNAVAPGFFESEMSHVLGAEQLASIKRRTPTGELCTVDQVLHLVEFLLFKAENVTGQSFFVDGGSSV